MSEQGVEALAPLTLLSDLPAFSRVLSGHTSEFLIKVPRQLAGHVGVLEVGMRGARILTTNSDRPDMQILLKQIRARLLYERYRLVEPALVCSQSLIDQLNDFSEVMPVVEAANPDRVDERSASRDLFEQWIEYAVRENATDLHIQIINNKAEVRVRIDGSLELIRDESGGIYTSVRAERAVAWAYNNASFRGSNSNSQFTSSENLYCMIEAREVLGRRITLRFQSIRGSAGVKVVCRLLDVSNDKPTLTYKQLGYADSHIMQLRQAAMTPSGFVLFAGVTGSGKTTSLKTFIETHPSNGAEAFYSIEDPVEYPLRGVHQIPVQRDLIDQEGSALKYGEVVGALMRADPGCVLMGEIRDSATAGAGQSIVETGHLACATVHAHLVSGIIPRLTDSEIGMSRFVLTNPHMLSILIYQALVPRLCPHCKLSVAAYPKSSEDYEEVEYIASQMHRLFGLDSSWFALRNLKGCEQCRRRGTVGLTVVAEVLTPDRAWLDLIRDRQDQAAIDHFRRVSDGDLHSACMDGKTVFEHTLFKATTGEVDPRQCLRFESLEHYAIQRV